MNESCKECDCKQVDKVCSILSLDQEIERLLKQEVNRYLESVDMHKTNPEIMGEVWAIISRIINDSNPYGEIKRYYNKEIIKMVPEIQNLIDNSDDKLNTALKIAISGNLVDFAAKHVFDSNMLKEKIHEVTENKLAIDDSKKMFKMLESINTLLYLGDNCGEIVLDKIFIQEIKKRNPVIKVYYGVRGLPIVNDITMEDAVMTGMSEVAEVVSNGDGALGTVLKNTCMEFQKKFQEADVVICKGQGNYESLLGNEKEHIYFLFMTKCEIITEPLHVPIFSIVCLKNR